MNDINPHTYYFQNNVETQCIRIIINNPCNLLKRTQIMQNFHENYQENQVILQFRL